MSLIEKFDRKALVPIIALLILGVFIYYWRVGSEENPGDYEVRAGNYRLEDGLLDQAEKEFKAAIKKNPEHVAAHLALAITYLQADRRQESLAEFNRTLELEPDHAVAYADRGILYDRMGEYEKALQDYRRSMELDAKATEGPGWLWRFMRNIDKKPPTVKDRADYLEAELKKPPAERVLKVPEVDAEQRMHKKEF